jgi:hypothetical protein
LRIVLCRPGPHYSVEDVANGWGRALDDLGNDVYSFQMGERLDFYTMAHIKGGKNGRRWIRAFDDATAGHLAMEGLASSCFKAWPDVVVFISGFFITPEMMRVIRARGMKTVVIFTESPYEESRQVELVRQGAPDIVILNDPINIERYRDLAPYVYYAPHAYDPDLHKPGPGYDEWRGDVGWVGTVYPSRADFMHNVDWSGLTLRLGGNWSSFAANDPLATKVVHRLADCMDNDNTVLLYQSVLSTFNTYRQEATTDDETVGWAMGPREVEAAATGVLLAREPRGEGDEILPMCPTFSSPGELGDVLRWWTRNDRARETCIAQAREAIADRTFENHARRLLAYLDEIPKFVA